MHQQYLLVQVVHATQVFIVFFLINDSLARTFSLLRSKSTSHNIPNDLSS